MTECTHRLNAVLPDLSSENRPEPVPPEPHRLVGDIDPALVKQILYIPQRKRVAKVHHNRQADDLGRRLEIPENAGVAHTARLATLADDGNPFFF